MLPSEAQAVMAQEESKGRKKVHIGIRASNPEDSGGNENLRRNVLH